MALNRWFAMVGGLLASLPFSVSRAADPVIGPEPLAIENSEAATAEEMKPYTDRIEGSDVTFDLVPIPPGTFTMGSPETEEGRNDDEGPQRQIKIEPFWMGKCEVTWDEYEIFMFSLDIRRRQVTGTEASPREVVADAVTRPTKPYTDMTFGKGKKHFPVSCMTQFSAKMFCQWLSAKTGRYYRLPTEAEWEYACRAGTNSAYSFGPDASNIDEYAWYYDNSAEKYHEVGQKKPNAWGLHDMHGNVAEWCADQYVPDYFELLSADGINANPFVEPSKVYPHPARGGSWDSDPEECRSASRLSSSKAWKKRDPQIPQSIWYLTDARFVGFRVVRPLVLPTEEERARLGPKPNEE